MLLSFLKEIIQEYLDVQVAFFYFLLFRRKNLEFLPEVRVNGVRSQHSAFTKSYPAEVLNIKRIRGVKSPDSRFNKPYTAVILNLET